jgi:vacuolar-type H+-ATPase subunit H
MDVLDTLDALEGQVRESPWIPFTRLRAVDLNTFEQLLRVAREQLERAQQESLPGVSRDEALRQAENEARLIIEAGRQEAREILSDDRITSLRTRYHDEIVGEGRQRANQHMREAYTYAAERMTAIESNLRELRDQIGGGLDVAQKTTRVAERNLRQRQKEVSREKAKARRQKIKEALF